MQVLYSTFNPQQSCTTTGKKTANEKAPKKANLRQEIGFYLITLLLAIKNI